MVARTGIADISNTAPTMCTGVFVASSSPWPIARPARRPDGRLTQPSDTNIPSDTSVTTTMRIVTTIQPQSLAGPRQVGEVHPEEAGDETQRQQDRGVHREHLADLGRLPRLGAAVGVERLGERRTRLVEPVGQP